MQSCLYSGVVRHRRLSPFVHRFRYRVSQLYLDLAELDQVFRGRLLWSTNRCAWARFRREDHLGDPQRSLADAVRDLVFEHHGYRPTGPIRLLTYPRYLGYEMNPVSFYFGFDAEDRALEFVIAEVNNTPWGERHPYVLDVRNAQRNGRMWRFCFPKAFHVSPFLEMEMEYDWRFSQPGSELVVHMQNRRAGALIFDATMQLRRRAITTSSLAGALLRHPLMTWKVAVAIYLQALKLWWKGCPPVAHPKYAQQKSNGVP